MKLIVNPHKIELVQEEAVNEKEINISKCVFEFNEEITDDFVKEAYFTLNGETYKKIIVNNECAIPQEVLVKEGTIELGVVATYTDIISQEVTRYNPTPVYFKTDLGSLKEAQNSEEITPSEMEQYEQALNDGLNTLNNAVDDLQDKVDSGYFKGEKGDKGDTGEQGAQGERGLQGEQGIQGEKGEKGDKGDKGDTGEKGQDGTNGKDGKDGAIQYTAGENISINGNVINAEVPEIDLSNYYNKNEVNNITGSLNDLDTENKTNLVNAINELVNASGDTGIIDLGENPQISIATSMHSIVGTHNPGVYIMNGAGTKITYGRNLIDSPISYNGINGLLIITGGDLTNGGDQVGYFFAGDRGMTITTYYNKNMYKNLLYNTANYNIAGTFTKEQTFDVLPKSAVAPTTDNQLTNKKYVDDITGTLSNLNTTDKSNLVNAINELASSSSGLPELTDSTIYLPGLAAGAYKIVNTTTITNSQGARLMVEGGSILIVVKYGNNSMGYVFARNGTLYYVYLSGYYTKDFGSLLEPYNTREYTPTGNYNPATKKYVDDSIAAIPSSSYTAGEGINIDNDKISSTMPIYLITNNTSQNPFIIENAKTGIYMFGYASSVYIKGYEEATNISSISLCNGFIILTNTTIDRTQTTWQQVGYIWGAQTHNIYKTLSHYAGTLVTRALDGKVQLGQSTGIASVPANGDCNIYDIKTFKTLPETTIAPTKDTQFTNKKYVDDAIASTAGGSDVSIYNFDIIGQNINDNQSLNATNKTALQELLNTLYTNGVDMFSLLVSGTNGMVMSDKEVKYQLLISPNRNTIELQNKPTILYFGGYIQPGWISGNMIAYLKMTISLTWSNDVCTVTSAEYSWTQTGFVDANEVLTKTNYTSYTPTSNYHPATKKYVDDKYKAYTGYDATKTQVLKNINGTLTWVDE